MLQKEIAERLKNASRAKGRLLKMWRCNNIPTSTKLAVFKATVLPALLYGCESWVPLASQLARMQGFITRSLKLIHKIR